MRILCDAFWWGRGPGANRTVQRELIAAWAAAFPEDRLVLALRRDAPADDLPAGVEAVRTRLWPHAASNRWELPRLAARVGADIALCHNYAPASGASLVFIHDVMFEDHPEWFSAAERRYFAPMLPWARRASAIAASTATEAARIARLAPHLPPAAVTGLGVPAALAEPGTRPAVVPEGQRYAVVVGRLNVRKNLGTAMLAAARASRIGPASPLYVVGGTAHSGVGAEIPEAARPLLEDGSIVLLGHVPDAELAWLYANAALVLALSLDEGFDMPSVEAASMGPPLVASDIPVHREMVGGIATLVPPLDVARIAEAIDATWDRRPPSESSRAIAERCTWEAAVRSLRAAAAEAVSAPRPVLPR